MQALFQSILFDPILNLFVALYNIVPDVGIVILIITVLIKLILYPLTKQSIIAQKSMTDIQPKLEELKKKYKDDQQKLAQETMTLYKENKVNPLGSCLPILIQLPIFIAIFWVFRAVLGGAELEGLYSFVQTPEVINTKSLGFIELGGINIILAALAAASQFWQAKMMQSKKPPKEAGEGGKDESMLSSMNKQMLYFMPGLTFIVGLQLPGGLALYWFLSTLLTALQQKVMFTKKEDKNKPEAIEGKVEDIK
jgi:YidC/Oxa1 family membrane protein insertase